MGPPQQCGRVDAVAGAVETEAAVGQSSQCRAPAKHSTGESGGPAPCACRVEQSLTRPILGSKPWVNRGRIEHFSDDIPLVHGVDAPAKGSGEDGRIKVLLLDIGEHHEHSGIRRGGGREMREHPFVHRQRRRRGHNAGAALSAEWQFIGLIPDRLAA